ncbi:Non-ribosomal peptide synthase, dehydrogenase domain-containing protein [Frankia sp. Hr75.2]|nr:Non-ribosomal peptide synthase, dehydrogenase domain-containing protein [Frankia sp. Hr75.2]
MRDGAFGGGVGSVDDPVPVGWSNRQGVTGMDATGGADPRAAGDEGADEAAQAPGGTVPRAAGGAVAITGGTGFLGVRLVRELLDRGRRLILLAHAGSPDALDRVRRFLIATGAGPALLADLPRRIRVVEVDVAQPALGLDARAFRELAENVHAVWHSAADTALAGDPGQLHRANVDGTRHVLDLVTAGPRRPSLFHVSTAFVAGARSARVVYEDDLDASEGFENAYERSKHDGEVLVREWAARHGRPAVVFRPSLLLTDLPPSPDLPPHTLDVVARAVMMIVSMAAEVTLTPEELDGAPRPTVRVVGDPLARLNVMAVEDAARDMVRIADHAQPAAVARPAGVATYHIVGDTEVTLPEIIDLFEGFFPAHLVAVPEPPADQTRVERMVDLLPGFSSYLRHRHTFDDTRARTVLGERPCGRRIDRDYLLAALGVGDLVEPELADARPSTATGDGLEALARARRERERRSVREPVTRTSR